jgi:hypothetical protein
MKRQNKLSEKQEVAVQAGKMTRAFRSARERQEEELAREVDALNHDFAVRREALVAQEYEALQ